MERSLTWRMSEFVSVLFATTNMMFYVSSFMCQINDIVLCYTVAGVDRSLPVLLAFKT